MKHFNIFIAGLVLSTLTYVCYGRIPQNVRSKIIVGGEPADIEEFPYQVSFYTADNSLCGGVIIASNVILTAAHCTYQYTSNPNNIIVRAGSNNFNTGGVTRRVSKVYVHDNFSTQNYDYDISLLILSSRLPVGSRSIDSILLQPSNMEVEEGRIAVATGYGTLYEDGPLSNVLRKVELPIVSTYTCQDIYGDNTISARMICAGFVEGGKDTCEGDSGGPLVLDGILVGITSWGNECAAPGQPGVYTKISSVRDYIDRVSELSNAE